MGSHDKLISGVIDSGRDGSSTASLKGNLKSIAQIEYLLIQYLFYLDDCLIVTKVIWPTSFSCHPPMLYQWADKECNLDPTSPELFSEGELIL